MMEMAAPTPRVRRISLQRQVARALSELHWWRCRRRMNAALHGQEEEAEEGDAEGRTRHQDDVACARIQHTESDKG